MTVTALDPATADKVDSALKSQSSYYGCTQIDTGNPLQLELLVRSLVRAYVYSDRRLGLVSYEWDCGECEYSLRERGPDHPMREIGTACVCKRNADIGFSLGTARPDAALPLDAR
jgi:hypothetical protein